MVDIRGGNVSTGSGYGEGLILFCFARFIILSMTIIFIQKSKTVIFMNVNYINDHSARHYGADGAPVYG